MSNNIIDLAVLLSLKCSIDALLPNIQTVEKNNIINKTREIFKSQQRTIQEILSLPFDEQIFEKKIKEKVFEKLIPTTQQSLKRYISRFDKGFLSSAGKISQTKKIQNSIESIKNPSGNNSEIHELTELLRELGQKKIQRSFSISDGITGSATQPTDEWDENIISIYDKDYEQPYIETLAIKLKPSFEEINLLYDWKRAMQPMDYEKLRDLFKKSIPLSDIEEYILPY